METKLRAQSKSKVTIQKSELENIISSFKGLGQPEREANVYGTV